jgi:hypothetical protein
MLGKEHIKATAFFAITALAFIIFMILNHFSQPITINTILTVIATTFYKYYLYMFLFIVGMMISATVPDIDISTNIQGVKIWNKIIGIGYQITKMIFTPLLGARTFSHRHLYHSVVGDIIYTILIGAVVFSIITLLLFSYSMIITQQINIQTSFIAAVFTSTYNLILQYKGLFLWFVVGAFIGFMAHLFEDTITVSGINYFPGLLHKRIAGKFITCTAAGYRNQKGDVTHVSFFKRSISGVILLSTFNVLFLFMFFELHLYLLPLILTGLIFYGSLVVFEFIFCGLKIKKDYY